VTGHTSRDTLFNVSSTPLARRVARLFCIGFDGVSVGPDVQQLIDRRVGSVIFFKRNVGTAQQLADLSRALKERAKGPLLINIDQEGGRVLRVVDGATPIPSMRLVGQVDDVNLTREVGRILAREMRACHIDQVNAPVLDVDTNAGNPVIGTRSFGRTPELVARHGVALIDGIQSEGVAACGKHFPGHGDTATDSHWTLPKLPHSMERLNEVELPPFQAAVSAGVAAIMTAHVMYEPLDPTYPATMSAKILKTIVRDRMGFNGVVISDDLEMKAITDHFGIDRAVVSGALATVDLFPVAHSAELQNRAIDALLHAVERGDVPEHLIDAANSRLDALCAKYVRPATPGPVSTVLGSPAHRRITDELLRRAETIDANGADPTAVMDQIALKKP
jgi:beta-N-acetylhexosaminidase